jgi:general stress protein 26
MTSDTRSDDVKKLAELIKDIRIAMLTTVDEDGSLRSRPMATQDVEFNGELWFMVGADSAKVHEVQEDQQVNVSFANPDNQQYVSVSGSAQLVRDRQKIDEFWNPMYKAWFPEGKDDPNIALLRVTVTKAEYWDSHSSPVVHLLGFAKALITGQSYDGGENEKVTL